MFGKLSGLTILVAAGLYVGSAQASSITLSKSLGGGSAKVVCEPSCQGLTTDSGWSNSSATVIGKTNGGGKPTFEGFEIDFDADPDTQLELLNAILGKNGLSTVSGAVKEDSEASHFDDMTYEYWAIKKSTNIVFFKNTLSVPVNFSLLKSDDTGVKWSHITFFGEKVPTTVPIPAAVWLFGSALIGMAGIGVRRSRQA